VTFVGFVFSIWCIVFAAFVAYPAFDARSPLTRSGRITAILYVVTLIVSAILVRSYVR